MLHLDPRHLARPFPLALLTSTTHSIASDPADGTADGIALTDTNEDILAAPTGVSLTQNNRDVDLDGVVDISLLATFSGGVAGITGYEFELSSATTSGGTYSIVTTAVSQTGKCWFKAVTLLYYRVRVRAIAWNGTGGTWSSYTTPIKPQGQTGAPANPTSVSVSPSYMAFAVSWTVPSEKDYAYSDVRIGGAGAAPPQGGITVTNNSCMILNQEMVITQYAWVRHVNTSGLASAWVRSASGTVPLQLTSDHLEPGAGGAMAVNNLGTGLTGNVNAGPASSTLLLLEWKCTSNTAGVTVTLGSKSQTFDFIDGAPFTMISRENGGGNFNASKSGGGTVSGAELVAIGIK